MQMWVNTELYINITQICQRSRGREKIINKLLPMIRKNTYPKPTANMIKLKYFGHLH